MHSHSLLSCPQSPFDTRLMRRYSLLALGSMMYLQALFLAAVWWTQIQMIAWIFILLCCLSKPNSTPCQIFSPARLEVEALLQRISYATDAVSRAAGSFCLALCTVGIQWLSTHSYDLTINQLEKVDFGDDAPTVTTQVGEEALSEHLACDDEHDDQFHDAFEHPSDRSQPGRPLATGEGCNTNTDTLLSISSFDCNVDPIVTSLRSSAANSLRTSTILTHARQPQRPACEVNKAPTNHQHAKTSSQMEKRRREHKEFVEAIRSGLSLDYLATVTKPLRQ